MPASRFSELPFNSKHSIHSQNSERSNSLNSRCGDISAVSSDVAELKDMVRALILDKKNQTPAPAPVKAVEQSCVTCGGGHSYQNCPATDGNIYRDNIQEYVSQAAAVNYNQGNASYRPQMVANQIRPPGFPPMQNIQNNQNRGINFNQNRGNNFNQNRGNNFNQGQVYQPQINQPPTFQAPAYQAPLPPAPGVSKPDFDNYVKANDAVMQNMQNQMANITDLITKFVNSNTASTSGSGSLPSNTIANPKGDVKAITTRSGVSYNGPQISSPPMENEPEVTKDTVQPSTENIQPSVVQTNDQIGEPVVCIHRQNPPCLTLQGQQRASFKLLNDKDKIIELTKTPVNENCSAVILKKFPEKLGDPENVQEVLEISESGNPTSTSDLMIDSRSPSFTPFGGSDFLMEEIDEFLEHDDSIPPDSPCYFQCPDRPTVIKAKNYLHLPLRDYLPIDAMPFGLCNAPGTIQRCKSLQSFTDIIVENHESSWMTSQSSVILSPLSFPIDKMLQRCEDTNLVLNWEKCHFMVKKGIVLGHKDYLNPGIDVDRQNLMSLENASSHYRRRESQFSSVQGRISDDLFRIFPNRPPYDPLL
ncbi:hypothetical protein Tco_0175569 [Tanacetum coccineum]